MATYRPLEPKEDQYTRVDNYLFDHIMPASPPNAWKVICFIVRKTRGWVDRETGERKSRDRLSYSQIMKGTGIKHPKTVSTAIQFLVTEKYVLAFGSKGEWEANEYELNTAFEVEIPTSKNESTSKSEAASASKNELGSTSKNEDTKESIKERKEKHIHIEKPNNGFSRVSPEHPQAQQPSLSLDGLSVPDAENDSQHEKAKKPRTKRASTGNPNTLPILDAYRKAYEEHTGFPYTFPGSDKKAAKTLADAGYTPEQVAAAYKDLCSDPWWSKRNNISLVNVSTEIGGILKKLGYSPSRDGSSVPYQAPKPNYLTPENLYT